LFVFPEGTRSPDGELKRFYRGAFWVAARYRVPVVPVVIEGTARVLPKRSFRIVPQEVTVRVLPPVNPADFDWNDRRLRDHVHELMAKTLAELRADARAVDAAPVSTPAGHVQDAPGHVRSFR
jgi:1-acyl-sn-glycerol-3-phosphate acyltransferase